MTAKRVRDRRFDILAILWERKYAHNPLPSIREIAAAEEVGFSTAYKDLKALVAMGYITPDPEKGTRPNRSYVPLVGAIRNQPSKY